MAITFVTNVVTQANPPIALSLGHAVSVGDLLLAIPISGNVPSSNPTVSISDTVNVMPWNIPSTLTYWQGNPFFLYLQLAWIRVDTAASSPGPTVTATFGSGFGFSALTLVQYTGFATNNPSFVIADYTVNHGTSTAPAATSLVNSLANELMIETGVCSGQNPTSLTGSFTNRQNFDNTTVGDVVEGTAGNTLTWGGSMSSSNSWISLLAGFADQPLMGQAIL